MPSGESKDARAPDGKEPREPGGDGVVEVGDRGGPDARIVRDRRRYNDAAEAIDDWRRYRRERNITLGGELTIRELIEEGRDRHITRLLGSGDDEDDRGE